MKAAVIGSGNIGTDLMVKILRSGGPVEIELMVGIDPDSEGLRRAAAHGVATTAEGVDGLLAHPLFSEVELVFDATSAASHRRHHDLLHAPGRRLIDLTPAAIGPYVVPTVNLGEHLEAPNLNMVTCGGQATVPVVAAIARAAPVHYAEAVVSVASRSAGPGTRANIDEFTETTAFALRRVGGAENAKAIIVLNPAEPPITMAATVTCLTGPAPAESVTSSVSAMAVDIAGFVPGYRVTRVQTEPVTSDSVLRSLAAPSHRSERMLETRVFLEVAGAADFLPAYAGNLDIMTSAALRVAQTIASEGHRA